MLLKIKSTIYRCLCIVVLCACQPIQPQSTGEVTSCSDADKIAIVQRAIDAILQEDKVGASVAFSEDGRLWFDNPPEFDSSSGEFKVVGTLDAKGKENVVELMGAISSIVSMIQLADVKVEGDTYSAMASITSQFYLDTGLPTDTIDQRYTIKFQNCEIVDWNGTYPEETLKSLKK